MSRTFATSSLLSRSMAVLQSTATRENRTCPDWIGSPRGIKPKPVIRSAACTRRIPGVGYRFSPFESKRKRSRMPLLIKAEELRGLISIEEAIAAVREGFRDQGEKPAYSAPRIRIQHGDRRVSVHPGGCHRLQVAGMFIHVERFTFHGGAQQYEMAGKRVYVAYHSETAALMTIIVGSLPLFEEPPEDWFGTETSITSAVGTDILARADCRVLGLYGTGRQARRHLVTMSMIRPSIEEVRVFSRRPEYPSWLL